jgi:hypothetical protein
MLSCCPHFADEEADLGEGDLPKVPQLLRQTWDLKPAPMTYMICAHSRAPCWVSLHTGPEYQLMAKVSQCQPSPSGR